MLEISSDKLKKPLRLEGKFVIIEEIQPKYFSYVVEWRNNPELNKFLNQSFKLTIELEKKWYEEKYLHDDTQGYLMLIDKATGAPFGTTGWTDFDSQKRRRIGGRSIVGNKKYLNSPAFIESAFLGSDLSYETVDVEYIHVVKQNKKALHMNKILGFVPNEGEIQFPNELFVNGMEQIEFYRTKEMYLQVREKLFERLSESLFT